MAAGSVNSYRDLKVWQEAMMLAEQCYETTRSYPKEEMYGMVSQIRRASVSVAANIAEGHGRESTGMFVQFSRTAQGSLKELETHLLLSQRVGLAGAGTIQPCLDRCDELGRMLRALIRSLQSRSEKS
ncbi:MAG: four helix bundle protein [Alphaproteobacteria bacterium]|nr:four helix bundle protein [Alphaproteobacteria bacterium]